MKVCDRHPNARAVDTLNLEVEATRIDMCAECRKAVLGLFSIPIEPGEPSVTTAKAAAKQKAPLGLSSFKDPSK